MLFLLSYYTLPEDTFCIKVDAKGSCLQSSNWFKCCICACAGLWGGLIIGVYTEFMTSYEHGPTQEVAKSTQTGAATNTSSSASLSDTSRVSYLSLCLLSPSTPPSPWPHTHCTFDSTQPNIHTELEASFST